MSNSARLPRIARLARRITLALGVGLASVAAPIAVLADVPPTAPSLPGSSDPAFAGALTAWLDNDEATALPALATLARTGHVAARVLLGLIDKTPALQGPYLAHLPRAGRLDLLREPGGLSGRSWLDEVQDEPLVAAWLTLWSVQATPAVIDTFLALNEPRAVREAVITLAARGNSGLIDRDPTTIDPDMLYVFWLSANRTHREALDSLIPAGDPQRLMMGERIDARELDLWLASNPAAAPLTALCAAVCPQTFEGTGSDGAEACPGTAYRLLNSHNGLMRLGTPAEALVDQQSFLHTPRGQSTVMRRILLATDMRGRRAMLAYAQDHAACLGEALMAEHQRYLPRLPGSQ